MPPTQTVAPVGPTAPATPVREALDPKRPCIHREPPLTPAGLLARPSLLVALGTLFALMAIAAAFDGGDLLLLWDRPIQHAVEAARTPALNRFFLLISSLASTVTVLSLGTGTALLVWRRCRAVATVVAVSMLSRPLLEFTLKLLVNRDRPNLGRLVAAHGFSFPSGHPLAAVAFWGLLPVVVTVYTRRRWIWWASVATSATLIVLIGASRVYLGVHWFSDVIASFILGAFFLLGVERFLRYQHRKHPCSRTDWTTAERAGAASNGRAADVSPEAQLEAQK